jgi:hypothetical protein
MTHFAQQRRELKGLLAESESEKERLEVAIANSLLVINAKANPFLQEFAELDADAVLVAAQSLKSQTDALKVVQEKIKKISKELL